MEMKANYKIHGGILEVTAVLPSGKEKTLVFMIEVLLLKCVSIFDLEFRFEDVDNQHYYYHL